MNTPRFKLAAAAGLLLAAWGAQAAVTTASGTIAFHNDVVQLNFTVAAAGPVKIWSDSWQSGLNFDPTAAVWAQSGGVYSLVAAVDDDDTVGLGQGFYDTGFAFANLAAGSYRITLATAINRPVGNLLSQGFAYDTETPVAIALWNQPTYDPNLNDQKGPAWRLSFDGVSQVSAVPEPQSVLLMALGLGLMALNAKRKKR